MRTPSKKPVLLLNASYEVLGRIDFNDAVVKMVTNKAYVFDSIPDVYVQGPPTPDGGRVRYPWPTCIVLNEYVHIDFGDVTPLDDVMAARMAVLKRDNFTCAYCGNAGSTYDHVFPKSRGGENTWLNLVAACTDCNGKKRDRTPEEAGMPLLWEPYVPSRDRFAADQKRVWKMLEDNDRALTQMED